VTTTVKGLGLGVVIVVVVRFRGRFVVRKFGGGRGVLWRLSGSVLEVLWRCMVDVHGGSRGGAWWMLHGGLSWWFGGAVAR